MSENFFNVYDDQLRADAYANLEFPGTYYLAYRDLLKIIGENVTGTCDLVLSVLYHPREFMSMSETRIAPWIIYVLENGE